MLQADLDDMIESNEDRMMEMEKNEQELQAMQDELKIRDEVANNMAERVCICSKITIFRVPSLWLAAE